MLAVAQTNDGYLWIGTEKRLIRFDGLNFRLFPQAIPESFQIGPIQELITDAEGDLWILMQDTKILRFHDGKFQLGREQLEFAVTAIGRRRNGTILFSSLVYGTLTYDDKKLGFSNRQPTRHPPRPQRRSNDELSSRLSWSTTVAAHGLAEPNTAVVSMAETTAGKLWLATRDRGLLCMSEERGAVREELARTITCLLALDNGQLWIGTQKGPVEWNGTKLTQAGVPSSLRPQRFLKRHFCCFGGDGEQFANGGIGEKAVAACGLCLH